MALPAPLVDHEIDALRDKGIRRLIVISAGFAEAGEEGARLQQRIRETARLF